MAFEFKLPDIGEGVVEGEIVSWKVQVGDDVAEDQPLVEVMTDKATVEIPSPRAGKVTHLNGAEGDVVEVGAVLVVLQEAGAAAAPTPAPTAPAAPAPAAPLAKAPAAAAAPAAAPAPAPAPPPAAAAPPVTAPSPRKPGAKVIATPATRRVARELGVELADVQGTGPSGRVTRSDVVAFSEGRRAPTAGGGTGLPFEHIPVPVSPGETRVKVRGLRRKISQAMTRSSMSIPHFSYVDEVDMTELVGMRARVNASLVARGEAKVSYLPFIMKACLLAFADHPEVNALYDATTEEIVTKPYFNCGLATDTPQGLYVSVIRDVASKSIVQLGQEIVDVTGRVRAGKGTREDLTDATFTITSIGNIGGLFATPIINYPEVAILGVNKIVERPVVRDGEVVVRHMTHLSPSFDHRVVDGANAARWVNRVIELLENPGLLLATL
jgi:pyruvate/2-oxoglutarate dehydrogenase complex dihydrolipoamide acyltransferase (E2) component